MFEDLRFAARTLIKNPGFAAAACLTLYRKLGVREVWYYERGTLIFFALRGERGRESYPEIARSEFLPQLPLKLILDLMQDASKSQTAAVRALRQALRHRDG